MKHQRGVVLIFTLIILLILTIGAVALVRSMSTSLFSAGNLAFRRDLVNQGETAVATVLTEFKAGGALVNATANSVQAANYSATMLPTNRQGVPNALLDGTAYAAVGTNGNIIIPVASPDIQIRYVIDRLCNVAGPASSAQCVMSSAAPTGGTAGSIAAVAPPTATVYRLSVRVDGPRSTQVFLQTTFTKPD
jgi:type IV pilus assembly protein PilX